MGMKRKLTGEFRYSDRRRRCLIIEGRTHGGFWRRVTKAEFDSHTKPAKGAPDYFVDNVQPCDGGSKIVSRYLVKPGLDLATEAIAGDLYVRYREMPDGTRYAMLEPDGVAIFGGTMTREQLGRIREERFAEFRATGRA